MASTVNKKKKSTSTRKRDRQDFVLNPLIRKNQPLNNRLKCLWPHFPRNTSPPPLPHSKKTWSTRCVMGDVQMEIRGWIAANAHNVEEGLGSSKWNNSYLLGNSQGVTLRLIFGQSQQYLLDVMWSSRSQWESVLLGKKSRAITMILIDFSQNMNTQDFFLRACLHGGGGPQVGEVTSLGGVTRLSI